MSSSRGRRSCRWRFVFPTRNFTATLLSWVLHWQGVEGTESGSEISSCFNISPLSFQQPEIIILWFNASTCRHLQNKHTLSPDWNSFDSNIILFFFSFLRTITVFSAHFWYLKIFKLLQFLGIPAIASLQMSSKGH